MSSIHIDTGLLKGLDLEAHNPEQLVDLSRAQDANVLEGVSFYDQTLRRVTFRGIAFNECNFARSTFDSVVFRKCTFSKVDLTRTRFRNCYFSDCRFLDCDPYYAHFVGTVVAPSAFRGCYPRKQDSNKALLLFAGLKRSFDGAGDHRAARAADYYYRRWERVLFYQRWRSKETSGVTPWLWSLLIGSLTGYGERPVYLAAWMVGLVTLAAFVYMTWLPSSVASAQSYWDYWYFSFRVFCAQGFAAAFAGVGLLICQVVEFAFGLVLISLLLGSIARKLS
jgi:hypothetical protein